MGFGVGIVAAGAVASEATALALCAGEFDFFAATVFFLEGAFFAACALLVSIVTCGIGIEEAAGTCVESCGGDS
jgi:hypothetical protein